MPPGWTELDLKIDNFYGFSYGLFQAPDGEIVLAYTGSNEGIDWLSNISDGLGLGSVQAAAAAVVFARAREQYGANITLTGHSLGGGLASIMSVWFNRPAVVFDHAPFELASRNPLFVQAAKVALALGGFELGEFLGYDGILNFATRELNVQGHHIEGEALQYVRAIAPTIGDSEALIVGNGLDGRDLHSMTLYVAAKMSPSFAQGTLQSAHFLPVIVDTNLYNTNAGKSIEKNFLIDLIRSEQSNIGNGKLSHFATDLHRLGQDLSGLSEAAQKAIVAQAVEWYYWQSSDYAGQEFSTRDGALLQYTSAMGASLVGAQNKAADYVSKWLTPGANDHGEFYYQSFGSTQQWNVATGATTGYIPCIQRAGIIRVEGEFLDGGLLGYKPFGNPQTTLPHGRANWFRAGFDLHSQALLTAFLQSEQSAWATRTPEQTLSEVSKKLTPLLEMLFSNKLYAYNAGDKENPPFANECTATNEMSYLCVA